MPRGNGNPAGPLGLIGPPQNIGGRATAWASIDIAVGAEPRIGQVNKGRLLAEEADALVNSNLHGLGTGVVDHNSHEQGATVVGVYSPGNVVGKNIEAAIKGVVQVGIRGGHAVLGKRGQQNSVLLNNLRTVAVKHRDLVEGTGQRAHLLVANHLGIGAIPRNNHRSVFGGWGNFTLG